MNVNFEFRRDTLIWLLGSALVLGIGVRVYEYVAGHRANLPLVVVRDSREASEIHRRLDSARAALDDARRRPLDVNRATAADFETLDGIGKVLAARLVEYRDQHGPYRTVDELLNVPGIGPKRLAAIRARCAVDSL